MDKRILLTKHALNKILSMVVKRLDSGVGSFTSHTSLVKLASIKKIRVLAYDGSSYLLILKMSKSVSLYVTIDTKDKSLTNNIDILKVDVLEDCTSIAIKIYDRLDYVTKIKITNSGNLEVKDLKLVKGKFFNTRLNIAYPELEDIRTLAYKLLEHIAINETMLRGLNLSIEFGASGVNISLSTTPEVNVSMPLTDFYLLNTNKFSDVKYKNTYLKLRYRIHKVTVCRNPISTSLLGNRVPSDFHIDGDDIRIDEIYTI